jgi:homoserine acetyltransferase
METYVDHAKEKFCLEYDANSLLYVSKAMDLFDLGAQNQHAAASRRAANIRCPESGALSSSSASCGLTLSDYPYEEQPDQAPADLVAGLAPLRDHPALVMGVASDILFPTWQQREIAETLRRAGNKRLTHVELGEDVSLFGHDSFLLDLEHIGVNLKRILE